MLKKRFSHLARSLTLTALALSLFACSEQNQPTKQAQSSTDNPSFEAKTASADYQAIEWTDLIPKDDLDALLNPPEYLQDIVDGSEEDVIDGQLKSKPSASTDDRYQQALVSQNIKPEFNDKKVRIPGFIVPLEFDDNQTVTTFFIVPFFGACLHQPPPPPNQIIYADFEQGIRLETLYDPFWFEGTLITAITENGIATSAYAMVADSITPYEE